MIKPVETMDDGEWRLHVEHLFHEQTEKRAELERRTDAKFEAVNARLSVRDKATWVIVTAVLTIAIGRVMAMVWPAATGTLP